MNNKDIKIEQIVLGTLLIDSSIFTNYKSKLSVNLFTEHIHQIIYETIEYLWNKEKPIDAILLIRELKFRVICLEEYLFEFMNIVCCY